MKLRDMLVSKLFRIFSLGAVVVSVSACGVDPESTGMEYASQMYHSIPYEPFTQIVDSSNEDFNSNPYNKWGNMQEHGMNMMLPVKGTIKRKFYAGQAKNKVADDIMEYNLGADDLETAAEVLKNPIPLNDAVLEQGKELYTSYCAPCHGANGDGGGKVAAMYKGVPNYSVGRYATLTEGHIFHTITHGKGTMWPHGSQVNPDERWRIVHYVQTLQKKNS